MILAVGYRVKSTRGNQFRIWKNRILKQHIKENELDTTTSVGISDISGNHRPAKLYNLDVII